MSKFLFKNAKIFCRAGGYDYDIKDIYVENGKITKIDNNICISSKDNVNTIDVKGFIICAGFIDVHTHSYKFGPIGTNADDIGIKKGSTTIFDAGTAGPNNIDDFIENDIKMSKTKVLSILNLSEDGLKTLNELDSIEKIDAESVEKAVCRNKDIIKGIKVRISGSVVGDMGVEPIEIAKKICRKYNIPLVVHIGNAPPFIEDILKLLDKGDIVTHIFHGKVNGILDSTGSVKEELREAIKRGVLLDVGHGSASFSKDVFKKALEQGVIPDLISTDLYYQNMDRGVVSITNVMNKLINLGLDIDDAIDKVTNIPSNIFNLDDRGKLIVGKCADLSIIKIEDADEYLEDSIKEKIYINKKIKLCKALISKGESSELFRYDY